MTEKGVMSVAIELYEHNRRAYEAAMDMMRRTGKAAIVHPTGTGKSFIGFKLAEDSQKRILWLTPSEYIVKTQLENLKNECGAELDNITFVTYLSLMLMTEGEIAELKPEIIICDEFHRAGAERWGEGVSRLCRMFPECPMLGLTATRIRYLDNRRDMAQELFDGNIASEMTLGEAIARNILLPPTYIISVYAYQKELRKYEDRVDRIINTGIRDKNQRELDKLRRALENAEGLDVVFDKHMKDRHGKYIVFCANKESMEELVGRANEWFGKIDRDMHIYKVTCDDPTASQDFADFKMDDTAHLKLLFCIDMLNEGVHVENVDGVILFRPTVSPIIYKQQIGRALSASKHKQPIIFDVVNNFENLCSISTIQNEINLAVSYYRDLGESEKIINESFTIIDETRDSGKLFRQLEKSLSATWDIYFHAAKEYYDKHGNLEVPSRYVTDDGLTLGMWLVTQRRIHKGDVAGTLSDGQVERLNAIDMIWDNVNEQRWENGFRHAKEYYEKHGTLDPKKSYVCDDGYELGVWVANNKSIRANNCRSKILTDERIRRLDEIGMVWSKGNMVWERNYLAAAKYYAEHGDLNVPVRYVTEDGIKLGAWISVLKMTRDGRTKHKPLTDEQIERLDMIGMMWNTKVDKVWEERYAEACEFYKEHGHLDVPVAYVTKNGTKLGVWMRRQRRNEKLSESKRAKLDKIGMIWTHEDPWEKRYRIAKEYYREHGDLNISQTCVMDNIWIGRWVYEQKRMKDSGKLDETKINLLNDIGITWVINKRSKRANIKA